MIQFLILISVISAICSGIFHAKVGDSKLEFQLHRTLTNQSSHRVNLISRNISIIIFCLSMIFLLLEIF